MVSLSIRRTHRKSHGFEIAFGALSICKFQGSSDVEALLM